jgi:hypothetical protein
MNQILLSLRALRPLRALVRQLSNDKTRNSVDWKSYDNQAVQEVYELYKELGWIKPIKNITERYKTLSVAVNYVNDRREKMLDDYIGEDKRLYYYMVAHSVFDIYDRDNSDWLVQYMICKIDPSDDEVDRLWSKPKVPEEILELLSDFNPEPVGIVFDPIIIRYGMWENGEDGRLRNPIHFEDTLFPKKASVYRDGLSVDVADIIRDIPDIDMEFGVVDINEDIDCSKIF